MWKKYEVLLFAARLLDGVPEEGSGHLGFYQDEQGPYYPARYFRALMKDCARAPGIEELRARVQAASVRPAKIYGVSRTPTAV